MNLEEALAAALHQIASLHAQVKVLMDDLAREQAAAREERAQLQARIDALMARVAELLAKRKKPKPVEPVTAGGAPDPTPTGESCTAGDGSPLGELCTVPEGGCEPEVDASSAPPLTELAAFKGRPMPPPKPEPEAKGPRKARTPRASAPLPTIQDPPIRPDTCGYCGKSRLETKETQQREFVEHVRGYVRRRVARRTRCTCLDCGRITTPPFPLACLPRTQFAANFVAFVLYSKLAMHLPWERVRNDLAQQGYFIASSSLNSVAQRSLEALGVIAKALWRQVMSGEYAHSDATGLSVVTPGRDHVHHGQMFVFGWQKVVVFRYQADKEGKTFKRMVERFRGTLILDASSTHNDALELPGVLWAGCNAHGLRKFRDAVPADPILGAEGERWVAAMFDKDREARETRGLTGDALLAWRQAEVVPIAAAFKKWIAAVHPTTAPKTPLREATTYYADYWRPLTRFLRDPNLPMDNNFAERNLRAEAVGRANWIYAGNAQAAENLAVGYTLVQTAKAEGVDVLDYLTWALERAWRCDDDVDRGALLTPAAYKEEQKARER